MNEINEIKQLLATYYNGQTTLEEESKLNKYFMGNSDLGELESYRSEFIYSHYLKNLRVDKDFKLIVSKRFNDSKWDYIFFKFNKNWMRIAASLVIFSIAFGLGRISKQSSRNEVELIGLQKEIKSLRSMIMITLFDQPKASDRLRAVEMAKELKSPEEETIRILAKAISEDDNTNVRIASVNALYDFGKYPEVKEVLINSLMSQDLPIVQMELLRVIQGLGYEIKPNELQILFMNSKIDPDVRIEIQNLTKSI